MCFFRRSEKSGRRRTQTFCLPEHRSLATYWAIQQNEPHVSSSHRPRDIRPTLAVPLNLKWILVPSVERFRGLSFLLAQRDAFAQLILQHVLSVLDKGRMSFDLIALSLRLYKWLDFFF